MIYIILYYKGVYKKGQNLGNTIFTRNNASESTLIELHNTTLNELTEVANILPTISLTGQSLKLNMSQNLSNKNPLLYNSPARKRDSIIVLHHGFATSTPKNVNK